MKSWMLGLATVLLAACGGGHEEHTTTKADEMAPAADSATAVVLPAMDYANDPICDMPASPAASSDTTLYDGKIVGFCSAECKAEFQKDPGAYAKLLKPKK